MNENQVGVLQIVNGNDAVEFFHVHRKKSDEDMKWVLGEIIDTRLFSRSPSKNIWKKLKEDAFEAVRQEKFTKMPSRSTCLFASATLETAKVWYDTFIGEKQLLKIKPICGKYVLLDEEIYEYKEFRDRKMKEDALDYWSGTCYEDTKKIAVLFEGRFTVKEEIKLPK